MERNYVTATLCIDSAGTRQLMSARKYGVPYRKFERMLFRRETEFLQTTNSGSLEWPRSRVVEANTVNSFKKWPRGHTLCISKTKMPPRPRWGAYSAPPDSLAGFKGAYF